MSGQCPIHIFPEDQHCCESVLVDVPFEYRNDIKAKYAHKYHSEGRREANLQMLDVQGKVEGGRLSLDYDDLAEVAESRANLCIRMTALAGYIFAQKCGIKPPKSKNERSIYLQLVDPKWWHGKLIRKQRKDIELFSIQNGFVQKLVSPYCSSIAFEGMRRRDEINQQRMAETKLVCGGEEITLLDAWKSSTSNPYNRFVELVTRIKGFEEIADGKGHQASFITITAPSKFHAYLSNGNKNPKYKGAKPIETHQHLMGIWKKVRAQFSKKNIDVYGLRIVEPHHDATPHYHMVVFGSEGDLQEANNIMLDYFTKEDNEELRGNTSIRFKAENIDKGRGSAVGYIIKYLAKNIAAESMNKKVGDDFEAGTPVIETSHKVVAWARIWGIRQFTFFGGAGVTVWRELRRHKVEFDDSLLEQLRQYAHKSDWGKYQSLMEEVQVKPYQIETFDDETGELRLNAYEEPISRIKGVKVGEKVYITRFKEWKKVMPIKKDNPLDLYH